MPASFLVSFAFIALLPLFFVPSSFAASFCSCDSISTETATQHFIRVYHIAVERADPPFEFISIFRCWSMKISWLLAHFFGTLLYNEFLCSCSTYFPLQFREPLHCKITLFNIISFSAAENSTVEPLQTTETETCQFSRSGRRVGSWMNRYHENYV